MGADSIVPSPEEAFSLYAKARLLEMQGTLPPLVKLHLPVMRRAAQPFMDAINNRWLTAPLEVSPPSISLIERREAE